MTYNFKKLEKKWTEKWLKSKVYEPDLDKAKKPFYNLMMFPYPSAEGLHVGNMYAFTGSDIYGRFQRMIGNDVFEPIGLDGFGIHSENYAIKIGAHPVTQAKKSEKNFYKQLQAIGNGFAWDERLATYDEEYYKWTQWIFVQMFKAGLAYRKKSEVNWCPSCKTVLADEQVIAGKCERCNSEVGKKELEQWFFKITNYAERLLNNLDKLDWSEKVKIAQKNWIGKSEGAEIDFEIKNSKLKITVFTTRPDTLFGATYLVLAPENKLIGELKPSIKNWSEVEAYVLKAKKMAEIDRIAENKEKTGVELAGVKAINPSTKEEIPVFVADYVIGGYGTGAVMAVPAHDERDYAFAKKFKLPIKQVIEPVFTQTQEPGKVMLNVPFYEREAIIAIVKHWSEEKYVGLKWKEVAWGTFVTGGIEKGQTDEEAARMEIREETGFLNPKLISELGMVHGKFYHVPKKVNRFAHSRVLYFELQNGDKEKVAAEETSKHELVWLTKEELKKFLTADTHVRALEMLNGRGYHTEEGILINSGKFNGVESDKAKKEITEFAGGKITTTYRLRDWLISRQRYWGPPIPMIHCENCDWVPVPEKDLPVKLPYVEDFRPKGTGESPLAAVKSFYEVKCPKCKGNARRETDVSDTFLDSAWYFFRYIDPKNKGVAFSEKRLKHWLPVNMYIGGAEHSVLHLLYTRFVTMFFKDIGLINFEEPFPKFRAHGLLISGGVKMSKSKGNVVNPDEYVQKFGADTLRMYLMFLGPFQQGGDWRDEGIMGVIRFINRVWAIGDKLSKSKPKRGEEVSAWMNPVIKKVTDDIQSLAYNTCVSELMIALNKLEADEPNHEDFKTMLLLLAPFAPFIAEELWEKLGNKKSIHIEKWPEFDESKLVGESFELIVQVNGKMRGKVVAPTGTTESEAKELALADKNVAAHVTGQIKKTIFVPGRLINFVV